MFESEDFWILIYIGIAILSMLATSIKAYWIKENRGEYAKKRFIRHRMIVFYVFWNKLGFFLFGYAISKERYIAAILPLFIATVMECHILFSKEIKEEQKDDDDIF